MVARISATYTQSHIELYLNVIFFFHFLPFTLLFSLYLIVIVFNIIKPQYSLSYFNNLITEYGVNLL
jgi:hypothetical protein